MGHGTVDIVPTGSGNPPVDVSSDGLTVFMGARGYFARTCTGSYDPGEYVALDLLGKTLRYTTDMSSAGCGCNGAFYLTSMSQNTQAGGGGDFYCDANCVGGVCCAEIDIQEANKFAWHSTLHNATDPDGKDAGYGGGESSWSGPRDWSSGQYGPNGQCVDTNHPFEVKISFPIDGQGTLTSMQVVLSQEGKPCTLSTSVAGYQGNVQLTAALKAGMTPVMSYWKSANMLWLDGRGSDGQGPCATDTQHCGQSVRFLGFSVEDMGGGPPPRQPTPASPPSQPTPASVPQGTCPAGQLQLSGTYCPDTSVECDCNYCDDGSQRTACAISCRVMNDIFQFNGWTAHELFPPLNNAGGEDCSWMAGTGQGGQGDNCQQCLESTLSCRRANPQGNCRGSPDP